MHLKSTCYYLSLTTFSTIKKYMLWNSIIFYFNLQEKKQPFKVIRSVPYQPYRLLRLCCYGLYQCMFCESMKCQSNRRLCWWLIDIVANTNCTRTYCTRRVHGKLKFIINFSFDCIFTVTNRSQSQPNAVGFELTCTLYFLLTEYLDFYILLTYVQNFRRVSKQL